MAEPFTISAVLALVLVAQVVTSPTTLPATAPATTATTALATTVPTSAPASAPAAALDQSSPKALLRSFFASRGEVDDATIRSLLHASNPIEQKVLDAVVQVELANTRLRSAEKQKFGAATTAPSVAAPLEPASLSELDAFVEKIDGDRATVSTGKEPNVSMDFVRIDGKWKLPIGSLVGKLDSTIAETMGAATAAQIRIIEGLTAEVREGKLTSEEQVRDALARRIAEKIAATHPATAAATSPSTSASTAPSTAPAAPPATSPATQPATRPTPAPPPPPASLPATTGVNPQ